MANLAVTTSNKTHLGCLCSKVHIYFLMKLEQRCQQNLFASTKHHGNAGVTAFIKSICFVEKYLSILGSWNQSCLSGTALKH